MKVNRITKWAGQGFIFLSALSLLSVRLTAFSNPQSVMDLVQVRLTNTDAFSSIRGVYGGVGMTLFVSLLYLMVRNVSKGLAFLSLLWGFYALSRLVTVFMDSVLGTFGRQWLIIESASCLIALALLWTNHKVKLPASEQRN